MTKRIILIGILFSFTLSFSQNYVATYKVSFIDRKDFLQKRKKSLLKENKDNIVFFNKIYKTTRPVKARLVFNNESSVYKVKKNMEVDEGKPFDPIYQRAGADRNYYSSSGKSFYKTSLNGKESYVIIKPKEWQLTPKTKTINDIKCGLLTYNLNKKSEIKIWYSLEHKVPYGPEKNFGLPGLAVRVFDRPVKFDLLSLKNTNEKIEIPQDITLKTLKEFKDDNNLNNFFKK